VEVRDHKPILITGSSGRIGRSLTRALVDAGADVWRLQRTQCGESNALTAVDLLDSAATAESLKGLASHVSVIHLAAIAHGQAPPFGHTRCSVNVRMMENLLAALGNSVEHFIFFSSVAVYGVNSLDGAVSIDAPVRPVNDYGLGKQRCEELLWNSSLPNIDVLRVAPVFDPTGLQEVRKRVFFPGLPVRFRLYPAPLHSLCSMRRIVTHVMHLLRRGPAGRRLHHLVDLEPYSQSHLCDLFDGFVVILPVCLARPLLWMSLLLPEPFGTLLCSSYSKLFRSSIYLPTPPDGVPIEDRARQNRTQPRA
jgi:nucleoside-diphosphate-sugar epimerase